MTGLASTPKPFLANRFAVLLDRFEVAAKNVDRPHRRFNALLREFESAATTSREQTPQSVRQGVDSSKRLLKEYESLIEKAKRHQELTAEDFNLLDVMDLVGDELRHSMLLAWLLDSDPRHGTHAQGNLGFRLFLKQLEHLGLKRSYADSHYRVRREVSGDESCVDICVEAPGEFVLYIENKIWSAEGDMQTHREWRDVQKLAKRTRTPRKAMHALFLSPDGRRPLNPYFKPISYRQIANVLDSFAEEAKAVDVKLFAKHYAEALRKYLITRIPEEESEHEAII